LISFRCLLQLCVLTLIVLVGCSKSNLNKSDDNSLNKWINIFGGDEWDMGHSVSLTKEGGYVVTGSTHTFGAEDTDVYVIKTDAAGNEVWSKTFGGSNNDWGKCVLTTNDSGSIIVGATKSFGAGGLDVYMVKIDALGNEQWTKTLGGSDGDEGYSIVSTSDNGFVIVGSTGSFGSGGKDVYMIKVDEVGIWVTLFH